MITKEIIESKKDILRFLAKGQLKNAFETLVKLSINAQDWQISAQISELETNYKYMLHYMFEGVQDPERDKMYKNVLRSLYEKTDDLCDELLTPSSSNIYFERLRIHNIKATSLADYHNSLKEVIISLSLNNLLDDSAAQEEQRRSLDVKRERIASDMFYATFASPRANSKSIQEFYNIIDSVDIASRDKSLFISALSLNLFHRFDMLKVQALMHGTTSNDTAVRARAIVSLVIVMQMYDVRWALYPELQQQLDVLGEDTNFRKTVRTVIIQLVRSRETEKISKKLTEEIIPEMMKFNRLAGKKLNIDDIVGETDFAEKNPEWQKELEESGLSKKLQEYSHLQLEGADVFHSTFAGLKNYPFFSDMSNWFLPFDPGYSEISPLFINSSKNNILHAAIADSGHMCNSDKYSFCLSILQISSTQREMMLGRLNAESEDIKQLQQDAKGLNPSIDEEIISNQYIQDLYRFFKLSINKKSFFDIFKLNINFYEKESIAPLISDMESMRKIALYCFDKNYFQEALNIFNKIAKDETQSDIWQKIAYCKQMLDDMDGALEAYLKADLITPNNSWIIRHIAQLYRNLKQPLQAITFYQKASRITPDNLNIELSIGHCYLEEKDYKNALNNYFKVEMLDGASHKALRPIAWTAFLMRKFDLSQRYYKRIIQETKPTVHDYLNAGHVELCSGSLKEALGFYKHAAEISSFDQFTELLEGDWEILKENKIEGKMYSYLIDQVGYSVS